MNNKRKAISVIIIGLLIIGAAAISKELRSDEKIDWFIGPYKGALSAYDFKDGVARMSFFTGMEKGEPVYKNIYLSSDGNEINKEEYDRARTKAPPGKTEIPNLAGYDYIFELHEGLALAIKNNGSIINQRHYFINEDGENIFGMEFDFAYDFSDGLAVVQFVGDQGKWSVIDINGKVVLKTAYRIMPFSEGLAPCFDRNKQKWGYININGEKVIPEMFKDVRCFQEGLAGVKTKEGWGYIKNPLL